MSPLGLPAGLGIGALMVDSTVQSLVRDMAIVLSSAEDNSLDLVGKHSAVMLDEWWSNDPSSRFFGFSKTVVLASVGIGVFEPMGGGAVDRLYRLIRSSVLPLARMTFWECLSVDAEGGEIARQRIADECALKRNVSANSILLSFPDETCVGFIGIFAVRPCRTRS